MQCTLYMCTITPAGSRAKHLSPFQHVLCSCWAQKQWHDTEAGHVPNTRPMATLMQTYCVAASQHAPSMLPVQVQQVSRQFLSCNCCISSSRVLRWYYAKSINVDEAYVFVCYDSRDGRARFTPPTAFKDPTTHPDAPPRQSIEIRSYVFLENEPEHDVARQL